MSMRLFSYTFMYILGIKYMYRMSKFIIIDSLSLLTTIIYYYRYAMLFEYSSVDNVYMLTNYFRIAIL